jgi:hypothetical protein
MSKKCICAVSESLLKEFEFLKQRVNEHSAFCSLCQTSFTVASGGRTSVSEHVAIKRHKSVVVTQSSNTKVSTFFKSIVPDKNGMAIVLPYCAAPPELQIHGLFFRFDKKSLQTKIYLLKNKSGSYNKTCDFSVGI